MATEGLTSTSATSTSRSTRSTTRSDSTVTVETDTSLHPMTTPFVQPSGCDTIRNFITRPFYEQNGGRFEDPSFQLVLYSDPLDPRFTACQPSGWSTRNIYSRFTYRPGVCPSGWTAYDLSAIGTGESRRSTAVCCARYVCFRRKS
jgi:hypothetical protein